MRDRDRVLERPSVLGFSYLYSSYMYFLGEELHKITMESVIMIIPPQPPPPLSPPSFCGTVIVLVLFLLCFIY